MNSTKNSFKNQNKIDLTLKDMVNAYEREIIVNTLKMMKGNQVETARKLGVCRRNLIYKINKYEIKISKVILNPETFTVNVI